MRLTLLTISLLCVLPFGFVSANEDWEILFDGTDNGKLRGYKMQNFPEHAWEIADNTLSTKINVENVDIVTVNTYANFELVYEWKVSKAGNSGLFFHVQEIYDMVSGDGNSPNWLNDFEIQILDDENFYDKAANRSAGSLYDLIPPTHKTVKPYGEYNQARLIVNKGHVKHYLNGTKVLDFTIGSKKLQSLINNSKFKGNKEFGKSSKGHIMFQHHGQKVWFRNIKVRTL